MGWLSIQEKIKPQQKSTLPDETASARKKQLRVLIIGPSFDILGGQSVQAARLVAELKREPSVDVSFLPINPRLPGVLRKLQSVKYLRTVVTSLLYLATLVARVPRYDIVHIFSASYFSFVIAPTPAILISKLYGKKVVLNYHSGHAVDHLRKWKTAIRTINLADELAVPSAYLVDVFARFGLKGRAIFNFVDMDVFRFRERKPLRPVLLSNRNFEPIYNVSCVLRAFHIIQQSYPQARLIVAGDGSERRLLENLARELALRGVEFRGRIEPDKMFELYDEADIFLNASEIDNMPISLIESFASGLPVVTTNAGGIPHIITNERTGLVVERGDYQAMAACAIRLLEDGELASRLALAAREECRQYQWESVKNEWLNLYLSVGRKAIKPDMIKTFHA